MQVRGHPCALIFTTWVLVWTSPLMQGCDSSSSAPPAAGFDLAWQPADGPPVTGTDGGGPGVDGPVTSGDGAADTGGAGDGSGTGDGATGDGATGDGSASDGSASDGSAGDGSAGDGSAGDGSAGDGSAGDAGPPDAGPPDVLPPDVLPADVLSPDTAAPPLTTNYGGDFTEVPKGTPFDLTTLVSGGALPLMCAFYVGPGLGTAPSGTTINGCQLDAATGPDDLPGVYGFIVVVGDQAGQQVQVPVLVRHGSCNNAAATVTPAEYPVRVVAAGSAYDWAWQLNDVDTPCEDAGCTSCSGCVQYQLLTKTPLQLSNFLDCANAGDVCVAVAGLQPSTSCPATVGWDAEVRVRQHAPLRSDGGPMWATVEVSADYSGTQSGATCGEKTWGCHIEVFEK